ncbi:hypothetical protein EUX98_g2261 [Antrodiella citrinella]|uniref:MYND-type domain-containing protein n=1 Tax=Antrodiella citrinella TaxID=2447956 RepID=A0A4S4N271_9APHY|nr:hypothetical protein EUX98_g2261 [Antrodiella citrinella]
MAPKADLNNPTIPQYICMVCGLPTTTRCSQCKRVMYCSAAHSKRETREAHPHLRQDWQRHKAECHPSTSANPPLETRNAILLAHNENRPRMIKLPVKHNPVSDIFSGETAMYEVPDKARHPWKTTDHPEWIGRLVRHGSRPLPGNRLLVAFINDNFCNDGSARNRCVENLTGGMAERPWADHIFVLRMGNLHDTDFQDAIMEEDLPILRSYMSS